MLFSSWLEKRRKRVMLIDADAQVSSSRWLDNRKSNIEYVTQSDPNWILDGFN
jgi:cellulose biosynthesis protein BcsQ